MKPRRVSTLCIPAWSDVLMASPGPPHLHLLHPELPVSFSFYLIKTNVGLAHLLWNLVAFCQTFCF